MGLLDEIYTTENKVWYLLKTEPETRDDDNLLLARYLEEFMLLDLSENFLVLIMENHIGTMFKTIERTRRKLQEKNPKLRGKRWEERHATEEIYEQYSFDFEF